MFPVDRIQNGCPTVAYLGRGQPQFPGVANHVGSLAAGGDGHGQKPGQPPYRILHNRGDHFAGADQGAVQVQDGRPYLAAGGPMFDGVRGIIS